MGEMNTAKPRINKFDNLKGLAIFLIVLGHVTYLTDFKSIDLIKNFIYIFHLPIFFFVAGYFSKTDSDQPLKAFKRLIIPYLIFNIIYRAYCFPFGWYGNEIFMVEPVYMTWFLLSLFIMKMILPVFDKLKYPLLISIAVALLFGYVNLGHDIIALSRTVSFFPVFLIGFYYKDYKAKLQRYYGKVNDFVENKLIIAIVTIVTILVSIVIAIYIPNDTIMMFYPYGDHYKFDMTVRLIIIMCGIIGTLLLNKYMTNRDFFLTKWGRNSMAIYIFQPVFILPLKYLTDSFLYPLGEAFCLIYTIALSILIVLILSPDRLTQYYNRFIDAFANIILKEN